MRERYLVLVRLGLHELEVHGVIVSVVVVRAQFDVVEALPGSEGRALRAVRVADAVVTGQGVVVGLLLVVLDLALARFHGPRHPVEEARQKGNVVLPRRLPGPGVRHRQKIVRKRGVIKARR